MNLISEFLGFDLEEVQEVSELQKEQAQKIIKLIEMKEWDVVEKYLQLQLDKIKDFPVEYYAEKPNQAHFNSGYKTAITEFNRFITAQKKIIDKLYDKETNGEKTT